MCKHALPTAVTLALLLLVAQGNVLAGETSGNPSTVDDKTVQSEQSKVTLTPAPVESPWEFDVKVWGWLPEFVGDVTLFNQKAHIDLDEGRVLRALRAAGFGELDLRYKRFTFQLEGFYAKIGLPVDPDGPIIRHIGVSIAVANIDWSVAYRPLEGRLGYLDLVAGARWLYLDLGLNIAPGPLGKPLILNRSLSGTEDTVDPYIGVRGRLNLSRRYYLAARGDYASFGIGSRVDWQVYGGLGAQLGRHWTVEAGYRYINLDYQATDFRFDMSVDGPQIKIGYTF